MDCKAQRIAFAALMGWSWDHEDGGQLYVEASVFGSPDVSYTKLPDPLEDLNVVHKAEDLLLGDEEERWDDYVHELGELIGRLHRSRFSIHASAAYRTEALLRVFNKWVK